MPDVVRAKLAEALRDQHAMAYDDDAAMYYCDCGMATGDYRDWADHMVDVLLSLEGVAIVALPERAPIPSHWNSDCLEGWLANPGDYPISAWPNAEIALADGTWMSAARARALATALLAATDVAEVATS